PLPRDDTTPPVTKMYFGANSSSFQDPLSDVLFFHGAAGQVSVEPRVAQLRQDTRDRRAARDTERDDIVAAQGRDSRIEPGVPVDRRAQIAVTGQPQPRELDRRASPHLARPRAGRRRRGHTLAERGGAVVRPLEHREGPT